MLPKKDYVGRLILNRKNFQFLFVLSSLFFTFSSTRKVRKTSNDAENTKIYQVFNFVEFSEDKLGCDYNANENYYDSAVDSWAAWEESDTVD